MIEVIRNRAENEHGLCGLLRYLLLAFCNRSCSIIYVSTLIPTEYTPLSHRPKRVPKFA